MVLGARGAHASTFAANAAMAARCVDTIILPSLCLSINLTYTQRRIINACK